MQVRIVIEYEIAPGGPRFSGQLRVLDPRKKTEYSQGLDASFCSKVATALAPKAVEEARRTAIKDGSPLCVLDAMFSAAT